ncbi:hypothetical protein Forpe1208_v013855 [Fusarium oxysporum f. sp. rapae]|uniref:Uncharacterized protein n=1 Tax=Fusarium oxysporum f. sp. rapae TaxID=485398 RepID=A0A8J5NTK5_FUSOX|nr:hypothetical protein Forpe1208_v013855 [Fusarium oxysporum f. sp. rapae]
MEPPKFLQPTEIHYWRLLYCGQNWGRCTKEEQGAIESLLEKYGSRVIVAGPETPQPSVISDGRLTNMTSIPGTPTRLPRERVWNTYDVTEEQWRHGLSREQNRPINQLASRYLPSNPPTQNRSISSPDPRASPRTVGQLQPRRTTPLSTPSRELIQPDPLDNIMKKNGEISQRHKASAQKFRASLHSAVDAEGDMAECVKKLADLRVQEEEMRREMEERDELETLPSEATRASFSARRRERKRRNKTNTYVPEREDNDFPPRE